ncbi:MAG: TonB-dependent receptor [Terracidiphilus sp.]
MRNLSLRAGRILGPLLIQAALVLGQAPGTGAIQGSVIDPSGHPMPNVSVTIENESTHLSRSVMTNAAGVFTAAMLPPGEYRSSVKVEGFAESKVGSLAVIVSETSTVQFRLRMATVDTSLEVQADAEMADTQSSSLGRAVDEKAIEALPLSNRNFTQILSLSPGVVVGLPDATELGRGTQDVEANGSKTTANNIQFNGVDANNLSQNSAASDGEEVGVAVPAPDTIQEFKVQTGNYDAAYGRGTGANVDVISKTGTDHLHGDVWEFLRNDLLNANDFFSKLDGQPRPDLKQNQFGFAIGGPIRRDKTFFFGAYQGLRSSNGEGTATTVILPQLTADRSAATLGAQFCAYPTSAGGTQVACDGSNINPVALSLLNFKLPNGQFAIPSPQILLGASGGPIPVGESTYAPPSTYNEDQYTANIDHALTDKNEISERFFYSRAPTVEAFSPNAANVPGWGTNELDQNAMAVVADTHVVNSNMINVVRAGYMRFDGIAAVANPILASDIGTQSPTGTSGAGIAAPGITVNGLFTIGDAGTPSQAQRTNSFIAQDMFSLTRHNHSIRIGGEVKRHQVMVNAPYSADGLLDINTFDDFLLGESAAQNASPNDESNVSSSDGSSGLFRKDERYTDIAGFIQDDVRLTPRLTVNAGLRYEIFGPPSEINGRLVTFDPTLAAMSAPASGSLSGFVVSSNFSGPVPQGVIQSDRRGLWPTDYHDVSPRVGFAYRLTDKANVVLRGGFGIYFDRLAAGLAENLVGQPPFSTSQFYAGSQNAGATLAQPYSPLLPSESSYPIFLPRIPGGGPTVTGISTHVVDPYTEEYNLNTQFAFFRDYLAEVGYVGTRSIHVAGCSEFNQSLLGSPTSPVYGATTNSVANVVQRAPYEGIGPGSLICQTAYSSDYNSLQASVTKRLSHGLQFLGSYTWSKNLDETSGSSGNQVFELWLLTNDQHNPQQAYGLTDFDRAHRAVFSFNYDLPAVRSMGSMVKHVASGWQTSGILVLQSGTPITLIDESAGAVYGNYPFENRAQLSGSPLTTHGSLYSRVINGYLDPSGTTSAPEAPFGTGPADTDFGNSGVGIVRGPGQFNLDMAAERTIPVTESQSVHLRAEFFNLSNRANFANPGNGAILGSSSPPFGLITGKSNNPRIVQVALKYQF